MDGYGPTPAVSSPGPHLAGVHATLGQAGTQHPVGDISVVGGQVAAQLVDELHLGLLQALRQLPCVTRSLSEGPRVRREPSGPSAPASSAGGLCPVPVTPTLCRSPCSSV